MRSSLSSFCVLVALACRSRTSPPAALRVARAVVVADPDATASPRRTNAARTALDERLHAQEALARTRRSWIDWEFIALTYMDRARLSCDYGDYVHASEALERAFSFASPGVGPFLTRARFNHTVHRIARVGADLDALRYAVLRADERAAVAHLRGDVAFYSGRYDEALRIYTDNLTTERSVTNLVALAQYRWKTGHFTEADALVTEAERALGDQSLRAWVALVRGSMEFDRGRWDNAIAAFREGLRLQPTSWVFQEHVAEVVALQGHTEEARLMYVDLVERTRDPEFIDALAQIEEGRRHDVEARALVARARAGYEERLRQMPEATAGHAIEFFIRRDPVRAVPIAELNRDARPGGEAQVYLAEAYFAVGRFDDARRLVEATLATPWNTADLHAIATRIYAHAGEAPRAATHRARALALNPHSFDDEVAHDAGASLTTGVPR